VVACATFVLWEKITVGGGKHLRTLLPVDFGVLLTPSGTYSPVWNWLEFCLTLFTLPTWQWPALPYELYTVDLLRSWDASLSTELFTMLSSLIKLHSIVRGVCHVSLFSTNCDGSIKSLKMRK
jgi:hypothetical protein